MKKEKKNVSTVSKGINDYKSYFRKSVRRGKELAYVKVAGNLFKRSIGYTFLQIVIERVRVPATQTASEKVTNMVGTFLPEDSIKSLFKRAIGYIFQKIVIECVRVPATQTASEKVTNMMGTFLKEDINGYIFKRAIGCIYLRGSFKGCASTCYSKGIRKGRRYGDYLFEF